MGALIRMGVPALILLGGAVLASGQNVLRPGELASAPAVAVASILPKSDIARVEGEHENLGKRLWIGSMLAVFGASSFDAASSWGKFESNPLLTSANGKFGAKGVSIKAGIGAALVVPQLLLRKRKQLRSEFAIANFATTGIFTGIAIHNLGIDRPKN